MAKITVTIKAGTAYIASPYNPEFVSRIKNCGGRWDAETRTWKISEQALDDARQIMQDIYGETDQQTAGTTVTLRAEIIDSIWETRKPIVIAGRVVASAFGRDSGARVGDNVAFIAGGPKSGGSVKNWQTCIDAGSIIKVYKVPAAKAREAVENPPYKGMVCVIEQPETIDRAALEAEREKLLARIAEIDAQLNQQK